MLCRERLDLTGAKNDLARLLRWQVELAAMPAGIQAGCLYLDAAQLRAGLEPGLKGAVGTIVGLLQELGREACRAQLEELLRRLQVLAARPVELDDFVGWSAEAQRVGVEREATLAGAAQVDEMYEVRAGLWTFPGPVKVACGSRSGGCWSTEQPCFSLSLPRPTHPATTQVLAQVGVKPSTAEAVRLDDLHEGVGRLAAELAACQAFIAQERPKQVAGLEGAVAELREEAILLEETLRVRWWGRGGGGGGKVLQEKTRRRWGKGEGGERLSRKAKDSGRRPLMNAVSALVGLVPCVRVCSKACMWIPRRPPARCWRTWRSKQRGWHRCSARLPASAACRRS